MDHARKPMPAVARVLVLALTWATAGDLIAQPAVPLPARFRVLQTPYYTVNTDLPPEDAQEAVLRLSRLAEEYVERTKAFGGRMPTKMPVFLFLEKQDYVGAGGSPDSMGHFFVDTRDGKNTRLLVYAGDRADPRRWQIIQARGFHQFARAAVGSLPTWAERGLGEYFGDAIWTGDGYVGGIIHPGRLKLLRPLMAEGRLLALPDLLRLRSDQWELLNAGNNYHHGWAMTHFLAHGENGKYQTGFANYIRAGNRQIPWEKAWVDAFGAPDKFEPKFAKWWNDLPEDPTAALYTRATLSTFTSFVARAHAQQKSYRTIEDLAAALKVGELRLVGESWLPPSLLDEAIVRSKRDSTTFAIEPSKTRGGPPTLVASRPDGMRLTASFPPRLAIPVKVTIVATQGPAIVAKPPTIVDPLRPPATPPAMPPARPPEPPVATNTPPAVPPTNRPPEPPVLVRPPAAGDAAPPNAAPQPPNQKATRIILGLAPARDKAMEFVTENCAMGKDHDMVVKFAQSLDKATTNNEEVKFIIGGRLLKSGLTTLVFVQQERCYIAELTLQQSATLGAPEGTMGVEFVRPHKETRGKPTVQLTAPALISPQPISATARTSWEFSFPRAVPPAERPYAIRLRYRVSQSGTLTIFTFREPPAAGNVKIDLPAMDEVTRAMPVMLFFDICHMPEDLDNAKAEVLSETFAVLVDVEPRAK